MQRNTTTRVAIAAGFLALLAVGASPSAAATFELEEDLLDDALPVGLGDAETVGYGTCVAVAIANGLWALAAICGLSGILSYKWCKANYTGWARWLCYTLV